MTKDQNNPCLLEQLEKELKGESAEEEEEEEQKEVDGTPTLSALHETIEGETVEEEARSREVQEEFQKVTQMKLQYEQDSSLEQVWLSVLYVLIY